MMIPRIDYVDHAQGAEQMKNLFPGVTEKDLPEGLGWALEFVTLTTHSGTHLDAPFHYHPTMDKGKRSLTIDEIPLEWCFGPGVLLDFQSQRQMGNGSRRQILKRNWAESTTTFSPWTSCSFGPGRTPAWGTAEYLTKGAGMDRGSTLYLTEKGV